MAVPLLVTAVVELKSGERYPLAVYRTEDREKVLPLCRGELYRIDYFRFVEFEGKKMISIPIVDEEDKPVANYLFSLTEYIIKEGILKNLQETGTGILYILPILHTEIGGVSKSMFEGYIPIYAEEKEAMELFLKLSKEIKPPYGLARKNGAFNFIAEEVFIHKGEPVFCSFVDKEKMGELKKLISKDSNEKKNIEFSVSSNSGDASIVIPLTGGRDITVSFPLYNSSILNTLSDSIGKAKILFLPQEHKGKIDGENSLSGKDFPIISIEMPDTLVLLCRLIKGADIFSRPAEIAKTADKPLHYRKRRLN